MTAEAWATELIARHGLPRTEEFYRVLLECTFSQGQLVGAMNSAESLKRVLDVVDAKHKAAA